MNPLFRIVAGLTGGTVYCTAMAILTAGELLSPDAPPDLVDGDAQQPAPKHRRLTQALQLLEGGEEMFYGSQGLKYNAEFLVGLGKAINSYTDLQYVPTSPLPMSGAVVFAAADSVHRVDMQVDDLMKICLSIGVMSSKVIRDQYVVLPQEVERAKDRL